MHRSKLPLGSIAESAASLDVARSLGTATAIGSPDQPGRSRMRRREFIAGLGSTAAWPVVARAQEPMPLVGFLYLGNRFGNLPAFRQGLAEAGFVEGKNVRFEFRGSANNGDLPALAVE